MSILVPFVLIIYIKYKFTIFLDLFYVCKLNRIRYFMVNTTPIVKNDKFTAKISGMVF